MGCGSPWDQLQCLLGLAMYMWLISDVPSEWLLARHTATWNSLSSTWKSRSDSGEHWKWAPTLVARQCFPNKQTICFWYLLSWFWFLVVIDQWLYQTPCLRYSTDLGYLLSAIYLTLSLPILSSYCHLSSNWLLPLDVHCSAKSWIQVTFDR